jgi:site-specific DNA-methyltransferase (adenine-specific)
MTIERWTLHHADVLTKLRELADESIDAIFCDPPYGLGPKQPTGEELVAYITGAGDLDTGGDFMGHGWSIPAVAVWREALRVLKPGGWLMAFGGSRTFDLIALGIRVAGFEIKDTLEWIYSKAMPKPLGTSDRFIDAHFGAEREVIGSRVLTGNAAMSTQEKGGTYGIQVGTVPAKAVDVKGPATPEAKRYAAHGQALKPGHEPIILARKPLIGTIAENLLLHDVCALNIGACRLAGGKAVPASLGSHTGLTSYGSRAGRKGRSLDDDAFNPALGRWPSNVLFSHDEACRAVGTKKIKANPPWYEHDGKPSTFLGSSGATSTTRHADADGAEEVEVFECVDGCPVRALDEQTGTLHTHGGQVRADMASMGYGGGSGSAREVRPSTGGASRFFYCAKVGTAERELGCEHLPVRDRNEVYGDGLNTDTKLRTEEQIESGEVERDGVRNIGPCLKPIKTTTWLASLTLPPPRPEPTRTMLVLYAGTCSEMIGAVRAGWDRVIGIERDPVFVEIGEARLQRWSEVPAEVDPLKAPPEKSDPRQKGLFE